MADDNEILQVSAPKRSVAGAAAIGGVKDAAQNALFLGAIDLVAQSYQSHVPTESFIKKLFTVPKDFHVNGNRFVQMTAIGAGIGLAIGGAYSTIGAIHYNREAQRWADRENAAMRGSSGMAKT